MNYIKNKNILIIIYLYIIIEISLCKKILYINILSELFWIYMFIYLVINIKKSYIRFRKNKKYFLFMTIISSIYVITYFYIGFIFSLCLLFLFFLKIF